MVSNISIMGKSTGATTSKITLDVLTLSVPYQDVYFPFLKAMKHTTVRLFESGKLEVESPSFLKMKLKYEF